MHWQPRCIFEPDYLTKSSNIKIHIVTRNANANPMAFSDFNSPDVHPCNWPNHGFGVPFMSLRSIALDLLWMGLSVFVPVVRIALTPSLVCPSLVFLVVRISF